MSLLSDVQNALEGVDYEKLIVTKGVNYKGRAGVRVSFFLENKIFFETLITDDLGLSNAEKADLVRTNAEKALSNYKKEAGK